MVAVLVPGEEVLLDVRPHWRRLAPALALVPVVVGAVSYGLAALPAGRFTAAARVALLTVAALLLILGTVRPWLRWRSRRLLVTNRRIVVREGLVARHGRDLPLARITDVSFSQRLAERVWGSGTLLIDTSGERGHVTFADVPQVETVHARVLHLLDGANLSVSP